MNGSPCLWDVSVSNHFHVLVYIGRPARLDDAGYRQPRVFHEGLFPSADGERIDRPQRFGASEFAAAKVYPGRRGAGSDQKGGAVVNGVCCGNLLQSSLDPFQIHGEVICSGGCMGYSKRQVRPTGKKSYRLVLIGGLLLLVFVTVSVFLLQGNVFGRKQTRRLPKFFEVGDYSDFMDEDFCKKHFVHGDEVETIRDRYRDDDIYRYSWFERRSEGLLEVGHAGSCDECSNKIVAKRNIWMASARRCDEEDYIKHQIDVKTTLFKCFINERNSIVAASSNIDCRKKSQQEIEELLLDAVSNVKGNSGGTVMMQVKTPKCYLEWCFCHKGNAFFVIKTMSDQLIKEKKDAETVMRLVEHIVERKTKTEMRKHNRTK